MQQVHEQKSARNKLQEQNQFYEEKNQSTSLTKKNQHATNSKARISTRQVTRTKIIAQQFHEQNHIN